ncbi:class I SAM-dependent DNA methyltransferase [Limibacillus halophilus]|uniref:SAM-dependent methyltransferase n=1 Tax=Limibacillus halophilus TaxID=1579333 RepID=A0A839SVE1_9PROT|nr:class I SAM-dependent methyltransferase [Limibacillus halophilus]MBB3064913.1 SAM-dependent methyltransferase [Limibacillus halophilus]
MTQLQPLPNVERFYDDLAAHYHLLFADWSAAVRNQGRLFSKLIEKELGEGPKRVLDAACGIGTQALGLALEGHQVRGTDLSPGSIMRARREADAWGIDAKFGVADLRSLSGYLPGPFDVVLAADNALPHLETREDLETALHEVASVLAPGGIFIATLRDYDRLVVERPRATKPRVYEEDEGGRRILFQVWDWDKKGDGYALTQYLIIERGLLQETLSFTSHYHALRREELERALTVAGFQAVSWLEKSESQFYQPAIIARRKA